MKIKSILAKLMKIPSLMDSCCLVDLITGCVKEISSKPSPTTKLKGCLLDSAKVDKENTKVKVCGEVLDKSPISTNQSFETLVTKSD